MKKLLFFYYLLLLIVVGSCTHQGPVNIAGNTLWNKDTQISQEFDIEQTTIEQYFNKPLTEEDKKQYKENFDRGREVYEQRKRSQSFLPGSVSLHYAAVGVPEMAIINLLKANNPKVCGVDRKITEANKHICIDEEFMLLLASAYVMLPEFLVFEGLRSRAAQKRNFDKGTTKTMDTRHYKDNPKGVAVDILGKDHKGKWSFQATDRIALAKGVIFAALVDLHSQGRLLCWEWEHATLWRFRDVYHVQLNRVRNCGERVTWMMKKLLRWWG